MDQPREIITIDGPAGAGKSTLARTLSDRLGWTLLDTGAMYRAVGLAVMEAGVDVNDEHAVTDVMDGLELTVSQGENNTRVFLSGREVTDFIRVPRISTLASTASSYAVVREAMVVLQRKIGLEGKIVAEGRDMGTVVFPKARIKFFLDADPKIRAGRRYEELIAKGHSVDLADVEKDMIQRDKNDASRALAPLRPAEDAIRIDSTRLTIKGVLDRMLDFVKEEL